MADVVTFEGRDAMNDFIVYVQRIHRFGLPDLRIIVRGNTASVFGCIQAPAGLLDATPTVLVLRSFRLHAGDSVRVDRVVTVRSLLDRFAHLDDNVVDLLLPDVESSASWAGVLPPASGWQVQYAVDVQSLREVARQGMLRVADELPKDVGAPVAQKIRAQVWDTEITPGMQAIAAYSAEIMGFLLNEGSCSVSRSQHWLRLTGAHGDVIVRQTLT